MKYIYFAIFSQEDDKTLVSVPDLPGLHTFGDNLADAFLMVQDAIEMWLWDAETKHEPIPESSSHDEVAKHRTSESDLISLVVADTDAYKRRNDTRAVKKTLSIPAWLNHQAEEANAPFSQILQQGLKEYLHLSK